jgi:hypothetical protein
VVAKRIERISRREIYRAAHPESHREARPDGGCTEGGEPRGLNGEFRAVGVRIRWHLDTPLGTEIRVRATYRGEKGIRGKLTAEKPNLDGRLDLQEPTVRSIRVRLLADFNAKSLLCQAEDCFLASRYPPQFRCDYQEVRLAGWLAEEHETPGKHF